MKNQVASIAGKKAGMKQGELAGVLKELGYTEEQVIVFPLYMTSNLLRTCLQVFKF